MPTGRNGEGRLAIANVVLSMTIAIVEAEERYVFALPRAPKARWASSVPIR